MEGTKEGDSNPTGLMVVAEDTDLALNTSVTAKSAGDEHASATASKAEQDEPAAYVQQVLEQDLQSNAEGGVVSHASSASPDASRDQKAKLAPDSSEVTAHATNGAVSTPANQAEICMPSDAVDGSAHPVDKNPLSGPEVGVADSVQNTVVSPHTVSVDSPADQTESTFQQQVPADDGNLQLPSETTSTKEESMVDLPVSANIYEVELEKHVEHGLCMNLGLSTDSQVVVRGFRKAGDDAVGPAESCGQISEGDVIVAIDDEDVQNLSFERVVGKLTTIEPHVRIRFLRASGEHEEEAEAALELTQPLKLPDDLAQTWQIKFSRKRRKRGQGAPKRPLSAYNVFFSEVRSELKSQHEGAGFEELGKMVGARWRGLTDDDKAPYIKKAASDKARYKLEMDAYHKKLKDEKGADVEGGKKRRRKKKHRKDPQAPKRPLSAYNFFFSQERARVKSENSETSFADLGRIVGGRWKDLNDEAKKVYIEKARVDRDRYEKEVAVYRQQQALQQQQQYRQQQVLAQQQQYRQQQAMAQQQQALAQQAMRAQVNRSKQGMPSKQPVAVAVPYNPNALVQQQQQMSNSLMASQYHALQNQMQANMRHHPHQAAQLQAAQMYHLQQQHVQGGAMTPQQMAQQQALVQQQAMQQQAMQQQMVQQQAMQQQMQQQLQQQQAVASLTSRQHQQYQMFQHNPEAYMSAATMHQQQEQEAYRQMQK